jgi:hypothetical protein
MRYYLTDGAGGYVGPFEAEAVRGKLREGELTAESLVCQEGGQQWLPASSFPELGAAPAPPPMPTPGAAAPPPYQAGAGHPQLSYVGPIIATVLCCTIGGIISIIYTATGNSALQQGDVATYQRHQSARSGWLIAAVVIGLICNLAAVFMMVAAEAANYGY